MVRLELVLRLIQKQRYKQKQKKDSFIRRHTTCHLLLTGKQNKNDNFNSDKTQIRHILITTYYSVVQQSAIVQAVESVKDRSWWKCFLKSNLLCVDYCCRM